MKPWYYSSRLRRVKCFFFCDFASFFVLLARNFGFTKTPRESFVCVRSSHSTVLSTRRHPAHPVSAKVLHPREIQALWPQNYHTGSYYGCTRQTAVSILIVQCHAIVALTGTNNIHTPATPKDYVKSVRCRRVLKENG